MKILRFIGDNIFFIFTLFLLAFIPLYPKLPLVDVKNTWVYIRAEDFVVVFILLVWLILFIRKKITLKTPITLPILLFWIIGAVATIHGVLLIFPGLANVFPNVAFLSFLRRIEYMSLFFIGYSGIKDNRSFLKYIVITLAVTLLLVVGYGIGQKYFGFPAYLTMNEEFAKGEAIRLSALSRVPSTFGGHYDLAAYLVLVIPILTSMVFGFRNWFIKLFFLATISLGFYLLFMTVSRVSVFVLVLSLFGVIFFQKKKIIMLFLPVMVVLAMLFLSLTPALFERFGNTVKQIDVLVDANTGEVIGNIKEVPASYFEHKIIKRRIFQSRYGLNSPAPTVEKDPLLASPSAIFPFAAVPKVATLVVPPNAPTGENLPQGTGYINLPLSPVTKRMGEFFYDKSSDPQASGSAESLIFYGNFLVKRASAYDLSFTTRFQGEWPKAIEAFKRNIFLGSGYSSISLAVDNNYFRILGEVGLFGFASFFAIFLIAGIYIKKLMPQVDSPLVKSFVIGFAAGVVGLMLNGIFIDVFEASKIAFLLWLLTGITLGLLHLYQNKNINLYEEFKKAVTSKYAITIYLLVTAVIVFSPMVSNHFVGDDFTWFRWAADCSSGAVGVGHCPSFLSSFFRYFTHADGFFYRPGTKAYFFLMYSAFWLNQTIYHVVSIFLHFITALLLYFLAKKILQNSILASLAAFLFLILSGYSEAVFWTSATGHLFNAVCILLSLLFYIAWEEKKKMIYFISCLFFFVLSLLFHELGIITPLLLILYKAFNQESFLPRKIFDKSYSIFLFLPLLPYLIIRFFAQSHWLNGDYSYNLIRFPFNTAGNLLGYFFLTLFGPIFLPIYEMIRSFSKNYILIAVPAFFILISGLVLFYRIVRDKLNKDEKRIVIFGIVFFVLSLLPFLGLGNIAPRYSYLASLGLILLFVFFIKKLYSRLLSEGKGIALAGATAVISLFCLLHVIQLQQIHSDWYEAGEKAKRFFVAIDSLYSDNWAKEPVEFHFVNVPIRVGEAWVFPVGLTDALWLIFRNPDIHVYQSGSVKQSLDGVDGSENKKVFEFDQSGNLIERKRILIVQ